VSQTLAPSDLGFLPHLGVTERCCADDLKEDPDERLPAIADRNAIVQKFIALRSLTNQGQETIRSIRGPFPVFSLHAGRQRGATATDSEHSVVWLLASQTHRGGDRSDAYSHFERLNARDLLFPTEADYIRLLERRNAEVIPVLLSRVSATLARAQERPREAHTVLLPEGLTMTLFVEPMAGSELGEVERLWMALDTQSLQSGWLTLIQAALTPGAGTQPWEYTQDFPTRPSDRRELRFKCWYEVHE
jgi:hypothetical protein